MSGTGLRVTREQVLAYRVHAAELDRRTAEPSKLAVLDLGVQDTPYGSAALALAARLPAGTAPGAGVWTEERSDEGRRRRKTPGPAPAEPAPASTAPGPARAERAPANTAPIITVWAARGGPHLHRRDDLVALAAALWPLSDADATARIDNPRIKEGAKLGLAAFTAAAEAMHAVVREPMAKGEVSTAVSARVPASLTYDCPPCAARHISGALFQQVGVAAGVQVQVRGSSTWLAPIDGWPGVPEAAAGTGSLVATYLRLLGPATPADVAKYLGTTPVQLRPAWPGELTEVEVDGGRTWLPADAVEALRAAPPPRLVRLLPPSDPYLQARDRALLLPDKDQRAAVWRALASPGALLVDGEIVGTWRARLAGRGRLDVTVEPFRPLPARARRSVEEEADPVAAARGATEARVSFGA